MKAKEEETPVAVGSVEQTAAIATADKLFQRMSESASLVRFVTTANEHLDQRRIGELLHGIRSEEQGEVEIEIPTDVGLILKHDDVLSRDFLSPEMFRVAVHRLLHVHLDADTLERNVKRAKKRAAESRAYTPRSSTIESRWDDDHLQVLLESLEDTGVRKGKKFDLSALAERVGLENDPASLERISARLRKWRKRLRGVTSIRRVNPRLETPHSVQLLHVLGSKFSRTENKKPAWGFIVDQVRERIGADDFVTQERCSADVTHKKKLLNV